MTLGAGENLIVYAVGSLADETFTFYVQERTVGSDAPAGGSDDAGDGTPAPTQVNTGDQIGTSSSTMVLTALAVGLFATAGGAALLGRRSAA